MAADLTQYSNLCLLLVILINFYTLGSARLGACIRAVALQGAVLAQISRVSSRWASPVIGSSQERTRAQGSRGARTAIARGRRIRAASIAIIPSGP